MTDKTYRIGNKDLTKQDLDDIGIDEKGNNTPAGIRQNTERMNDAAKKKKWIKKEDAEKSEKEKSAKSSSASPKKMRKNMYGSDE